MEALLNTNHQTLSAHATRRTFEGREHLVVPVIPIVEGVLNRFLVPADEIDAFVQSWNGIPLPVDHPTANGKFISANTPEIIERQGVGRFFHAHMDGPKLKGELWIDIAKCEALGGDALEAMTRLESSNKLEVSTAFWSTDEMTAGEFKGKPYSGIRRQLRPDHLALLPWDKGACSWEDGAGAPRVNKAEGESKTMLDKIREKFFGLAEALGLTVNAQPSNDDVREALAEAISEVKKVTEYVPVVNSKEDEIPMDKDKIVNALIAHAAAPFDETSRAALTALPETALAAMQKTYCVEPPAKQADPAPVVNVAAPAGIVITPEEKAFLDRSLATHKQAKDALVAKLSANKACPFKAKRLAVLDVDELEALDKSLTSQTANYAGAAGGAVKANKDDAPPPPPAVFLAPSDK